MHPFICSLMFFLLAFSSTQGQTIVTDSILYQGLTNQLKTINDSLDIYGVDEFDYNIFESASNMPMIVTLTHFLNNSPYIIFIGVHIACLENQQPALETAQTIADNIQKALIANGIEKQRLRAYGLEPCLEMNQAQEESKPGFTSFRVTIKMIGLSSKSEAEQEHSVENGPGKIVLDVCVNAKGFVLYVKPDLKKSTSTDQQLIDKAIANAYNWKFSPSASSLQCGSVTYNFHNASGR